MFIFNKDSPYFGIGNIYSTIFSILYISSQLRVIHATDRLLYPSATADGKVFKVMTLNSLIISAFGYLEPA